ncbi:MAG: cobaltochelatase subunit CobN [Thauera sp.]|jgi:cobaltochelatase CobN|nr:cobaltochelatase subunit CobN [Thauera sp.]
MIRLLSVLLALWMSCFAYASDDKPKVLMLASSKVMAKTKLLEKLAQEQPFELQVLTKLDELGEDELAGHWGNARLVLLDGLNPLLSNSLFETHQALLKRFADIPVVALGNIDAPALNQGVSEAQRQTLDAYSRNAGRMNYQNMLSYLASAVLSLNETQVAPPVEVPPQGLYHPDYPQQLTDNAPDFFGWLQPVADQPLIAIGMHRGVVDYEQSTVVDALIERLSAKGAKVFGFYYDENDQLQDFKALFANPQQVPLRLMINYRSMHYVDKRRQEFEALGVPVIQALNYTDGDEEAFRKDHAGISANMTPFFLVMPEDAGVIDPTVIATSYKGETAIMEPQLNALVERAYNHARLGLLANADKKIATFIWNYPPGERNVGAAFLDVPASIEQIADTLKQQGYAIEPRPADILVEEATQLLRPYYRGEGLEALLDQGLAELLPLERYLAWFNALPEYVRTPINERWGEPQNSKALVERAGKQFFIIPRLSLGNMIVLPQGLRGDSAEEHSKLYHDTKQAINHSYLATYLYVREIFAANALIHLGTHGSQEWLGGKERGLSVYDAPDLVIGNLPVFYPYIIDNVGEAMQAKRRGRATMVSHLTPGFAKAGLYADVARLMELTGNYLLLDDGQTRSNTREQIITLSKSINLLQDMQISEQQLVENFDTEINRLQDHLEAIARQSQPLGVHIFGKLPKEAHLYTTILQILGDDFALAAAAYEKQHGLALPVAENTDRNGVLKLEALDGFQLLQAYIEGRELKGLPETLQTALQEAREHWDNFHGIHELETLVEALEGKYVPVSYGGDPIRNPQVAPTGRNLIGFNPAKVPSAEAYAAGVQLMDQTIADYVAKHGRYPEKLAFSLWSLETMRHQGALEAQILHAIGVKPVWNRQGQVTGTEIIPYAELKRPRIDVVVSPTGLYRDAFPNVLLWMADAIDKVARLKEDNNFLHRNHLAMKQQLQDEGRSEDDADYLSTVRIFSNQSGHYGTGLADATLDSGNWDSDADMAENYLKRMGFAFGKDPKRWSEQVADAQLYSKVLSGTDGVIFSRSTNLYALMTNDDPFQYFGGIGLAVRHLDGKTPEMFVSNLRRSDDLKVQSLETFINQEFRSRYFHPRWIEAMQEAGYAGATTILDRMNNMWGWEVMTPDAIRDDHWKEFFDVYIEDKYQLDIQAFFEEHNADALAQILERMLEAVRKGYWQADEETLKKMLETYTDLANRHDLFSSNDAFKDYVNQQASGFGLSPLAALAAAAAAAAQPAAAQTQQVSGQQLEQVEHSEHEADQRVWYLISLIFAAGLVSPFVRRPA